MKRRAGAIAVLILMGAMAQSQDADPQQPLGDIARGQQELHPKSQSAGERVYTDEDFTNQSKLVDGSEVNEAPSAPESKASGTERNRDQAKPKDSVAQSGKSLRAQSVFDRKHDSADDVIVVPAGTKIQVNMMDRDVEAPVRLRFSTPIPALTKVSLHIYGSHYRGGYYASLARITIGDVTYRVQSDTVPCATGDGVFTLTAPLRIKR
ncbi:MAG: hypothetical protein ACRD2U_08200 [Terriglobales bacterium]